MYARKRDVTADGLSRVAAVVASYSESPETVADAAVAPGEKAAPPTGAEASGLDDLIAKAAMAMERHAEAAQGIRRRGAAYNTKGRTAPTRDPIGEPADGTPRKLDIIR